MSPTFISIIPDLRDGEGHMYHYHRRLGDALSKLGMRHSVLYDSKTLSVKDPGWSRCLKSRELDRPMKSYFSFRILCSLPFELVRFYRTLKSNLRNIRGEKIVFVERFNVPIFLCLALTLCFLPSSRFWVLFRFDKRHYGRKLCFYKFGLALMSVQSKCQPKLITDSEILKIDLEAAFGKKVSIFPVPVINIENLSDPNGKFIFWWPGAPREEKGWEVMRRLSESLLRDPIDKVELVLAKSAFSIACRCIRFVDDVLSPEVYAAELARSRIILLPYDEKRYHGSTSGIFVEAISHGKCVFVTEGTWMASELIKFDLFELIFSKESFIQVGVRGMLDIVQRRTTAKKILQMKQAYTSFHSTQRLAECVREIYECKNAA